MKKLIILIGVFAVVGCGGGGGSSSGGGTYNGIWQFNGVKVLDECGSGAPSLAAIQNLIVNQDGNNIVVNSGQITLTGTTNNDDGFLVSTQTVSPQGCPIGYGYSFSDASDGDADVAIAIVVTCGNAQCRLGFAGNAIRDGSRSLITSSDSIESLANSLDTSLGSLVDADSDSEAVASDLASELN